MQEWSTKKLDVASAKPEFFRLPKAGEMDPFFGLKRSWYYAAEKRGQIRLVRLRDRGRLRGVTLIAYDQLATLIYDLQQGQDSLCQRPKIS